MLMDLPQLFEDWRLEISGVIHIGAHFGKEVETYARIPSIRNVVLFEPHPDTFRKLQENLAAWKSHFDYLQAIPVGLGPFSCRMDMFTETANEGQSNSLLRPTGHLKQYPGIVFEGTREVQVRPLDDFKADSRMNFINIDVQGFELEVLRGARRTLPQIQAVMTEVNREELYRGCCLVEELDDFLGKFGLSRQATNWAGGSWGDALYVRDC